MKLVIFGSGPMPCEPQFTVLAPGSRTWQIVQTAALALAEVAGPHQIIVFGLETYERPDAGAIDVSRPESPDISIKYIPLAVEQFLQIPYVSRMAGETIPTEADAVVGCASIQPCATAAEFAAARKCPLWVDLFGDPFAEIQSKAELYPAEKDANNARYMHIWKLMLPVLMQGDCFSALSGRQRYAVIGQLGCVGRLNRHTKGRELVHTIPYALFPGDFPELLQPPQKSNFIVMWCGSFNTWMDVDALVQGLADAMAANRDIRLLVVGGKIDIYHEKSYAQFVEGIREAEIENLVKFMDWQPLSQMKRLYAACDVGLSIDRYTYEAVLGSRTRVVNFLAAARPVISTTASELTEDMAEAGYVFPYKLNDPADLTRALLEAAGRKDLYELGIAARGAIVELYSGETAGHPLADWIRSPQFAPDREEGKLDRGNPLISHWDVIKKSL